VIGRRAFFRGLFAGGAAVAFGALWVGRWSSRVRRRPTGPLKFLSPKEYSILTAVAETMLPRGPDTPAFHRIDTVERIDDTLAHMPGHKTRDVPGLLWAIEHLPAVTTGKLGTFTALSDASRTAVLRSWERNDSAYLRTAFAGLKYLVMLHYYADRRSWDSIGYVPVRLPQWDAV